MSEDLEEWQSWMIGGLSVTVVLLMVASLLLLLRLRRLRREREAIIREERRMFDFLHGLGERMQQTGSSAAMHKVVVGGAVKVVGARGGILYLFNPTRQELIPAFVSTLCPALTPIPPEILAALEQNPKALRGHQQIRCLSLAHSPLAESFQDRKARMFTHFTGLVPTVDGMTTPGPVPVMFSPIYHGDDPLGLLVVARDNPNRPFSANDFSVFQSVAEQSGFAMLNAMTHKEASEKRLLEAELRTASEIQRILLPESAPEVPGYCICGTNKPARIVSGDYFDYIPVDAMRTGIAIADVSGKGIAASLVTAMCRSILRVAAPANLSPSDALARLNRMLYPDIREDMFISLAYVIINHNDGNLMLGRAGHDAPLLYRAATRSVEHVRCPGLALGVDEGPVFERVTRDYGFSMESGDLLLLYTDGVNEALNIHGDEFGMTRLIDLLRDVSPNGAMAVIQAVTAAVDAFVGDHPQSDDITLIAIEKR